MNELNEKQKIFCQEYIVDNNATHAAIRAGYSKRSADTIASRLLRKDKSQAYIATLRAKQCKRLNITADKVADEIAKIAFFDMSKLYNDDGSVKQLSELDDNTRAALSENGLKALGSGDMTQIVKYMKTYDKLKALELLGKTLGIFVDNTKVEHSGTVLKRIINVNPTKGT